MKKAFALVGNLGAVIDAPDCVYIYKYDGYDDMHGEAYGYVKDIDRSFDDVMSEFAAHNISLVPARYLGCDNVQYFINPKYFQLFVDEKDPEGFTLQNKTRLRDHLKPMKADFSSPLSLAEFKEMQSPTKLEHDSSPEIDNLTPSLVY